LDLTGTGSCVLACDSKDDVEGWSAGGYDSSDKTACGAALASLSTMLADCTKICARVRVLVSSAKSASRMKLSAAVTFSYWIFSELAVVLSVFR